MSPLDPGTSQSKLGLISYIIAFATWTWVLFVAPAISIIYFRSTRIDAPMRIRILVSAHGVSIAALYVVAAFVFEMNLSKTSYGNPYAIAFLIPVLLIACSLAFYRGPKRIHLLQFVNLACIVWTFFVGMMAVTGDWL